MRALMADFILRFLTGTICPSPRAVPQTLEKIAQSSRDGENPLRTYGMRRVYGQFQEKVLFGRMCVSYASARKLHTFKDS